MHDRPLGIKILCVLQLFGAGGMLCLFCAGGPHVMRLGQQLGSISSLTPRAFVAYMMAMGYLYLFATFGMYTGRAWGWWLGTCMHAYFAAGNSLNLIQVALARDQFRYVPASDLRALQAKLLVRGVFAALIVLYLLQEPVREFYKLADRSAWFDLLIVLFVVVIAAFAMTIGLGTV